MSVQAIEETSKEKNLIQNMPKKVGHPGTAACQFWAALAIQG